MKFIQLQYNGKGKRTLDIQMHGFMGPARSPMGKGPLKVGDDYIRPGTLTTAFQLNVPPSGECQLVDCQHNREVLRKVTIPRKFWEDVKHFNQETGKYEVKREQLEQPPAFTVLDGTPINEDIQLDIPLSNNPEVRELQEKIMEIEGKDKEENTKPPPDATATGERALEPETDPEEGHKPPTSAELTKNRFANKIPDPVSLV